MSNRVMLFATMDARREFGNRKQNEPRAARRNFRNELRGQQVEYTLQVLAPYGDNSYQMDIEVNASIPGSELLRTAKPGDPLKLEGYLAVVEDLDTRFLDIDDDAHQGRRVREVRMVVTSAATPTDSEPRGGSGAWLEGTITEPAVFGRHPNHKEMRIARTRIRVMTEIADPSGLLPPVHRPSDIMVAVPVEGVENADMLYRPGNVVKISGRIDAMLMRQHGNDVQTRIEEIDQRWQQTKAELAGKPRELAQAKRRYHSTRRNWSDSPSLFIIASTVETISGEPGSEAECRKQRQEFAQAIRERVNARRERDERAKANRIAAQQQRVADAGESTQEPPAEPLRPRRRDTEPAENENGIREDTETTAEAVPEIAEIEEADVTEPEPVANGVAPVL